MQHLFVSMFSRQQSLSALRGICTLDNFTNRHTHILFTYLHTFEWIQEWMKIIGHLSDFTTKCCGFLWNCH